jgi:acetolactate synthase-1/2/3 large subunit
MLSTPGPVILDVAVDETEMCFPMIPGGAAHNEIMLRRQDQTTSDPAAREEGMVLV